MTPPPEPATSPAGDSEKAAHAEARTPGERTTADGPVLREHVYDGIMEFDQKLPNWWLFSWYIFIALFIVYWLADYQFGMLPGAYEEIDQEMAAINDAKAKELAQLMATLDDPSFWGMSRDPEAVAAGAEIYSKNCVSCHGADLSATLGGVKLPGLPLNDSEWQYGGRPMDVFKIVSEGSPDKTKGMISWEPVLGGRKVAEVVAFLMSHHQETGDTPGGPPSAE